MCYGVQWGSPNARLLYEPNKKAGIYNQVKPRSWKEREAGKTRTKNVVTAYVKQLLSDSKVDFKQLGKIYRPDQDIPEATVRRLFKQKEIQAMVDKKLDELLTNKGITKEMVLDLHLKALEMAESKSDVSNFLRATENFMKLLKKNIETRRIWRPLNLQLHLKKFQTHNILNASKLYFSSLCLPSDDNISNSDVDKISNHIKKFHETVINNKL